VFPWIEWGRTHDRRVDVGRNMTFPVGQSADRVDEHRDQSGVPPTGSFLPASFNASGSTVRTVVPRARVGPPLYLLYQVYLI